MKMGEVEEKCGLEIVSWGTVAPSGGVLYSDACGKERGERQEIMNLWRTFFEHFLIIESLKNGLEGTIMVVNGEFSAMVW